VKVAILNTVALNGGDAAILQAVMALARSAFGEDTTFVVFDTHAEVAQRHYPAIHFRPQLWVSATKGRTLPGDLNALRVFAAIDLPRMRKLLLGDEERESISIISQCDLVVSTGGTYFVPTYRLRPRAFELAVAQGLEKPCVLFTQSIGHFPRWLDRYHLRVLLQKAGLVMLRDPPSLANVLALGVPSSKCVVSPDAVFGIAEPGTLSRASTRRLPARSPRIVISVRDLTRFGSRQRQAIFEGAIVVLTAHLVNAHDARVSFLSTCQGIPEYGIDDSEVATRIVAGLGPAVREKVEVDRAFHPPEEIARRLGEADLVVATRMHAGILALTAGTPVLPIAYEFKTKELFESLGFGDHVLEAQKLTEPSVIGAADRFIREIDSRRADLFARVEELRVRVRTDALRLREVVR